MNFQLQTSRGRIWLKDGDNIEIYSLNGSFCRNELWKFNLLRTVQQNVITGSVQKILGGVNVGFSQLEAEQALRSNFYQSTNIIFIDQGAIPFNPLIGTNVVFTLRTKINQQMQLRIYQNLSHSMLDPAVGQIHFQTGSVSPKDSLANIHGLLTTTSAFPIEQCAEILAKKFPRELITWLSYCTNTEAYRNYFF